jgi:hypothetical protein
MKKLSSLLKWLIGSFIFIVSIEIVSILGRLSKLFFDSENVSKKILQINLTEQLSNTGYTIVGVISIIVFLYLLYHLIRFFSAIKDFSENQIFTEKNIKWLNSAGKAIFLVTFILIFFELSNGLHNLGEEFGKTVVNGNFFSKFGARLGYNFGYCLGYLSALLYKWIPLLILGALISVISELLKAGSFIKKENELTI